MYNSKIVLRQGDQCNYPLPIYVGNVLISDMDVDEVEFQIGSFVRKLFSEGGITFNNISNMFEIRLDQTDTFYILPSRSQKGGYFEYPTQIRVKLKNCGEDGGYVYSFVGPNVEVLESLSKERI